MSWKLKRIRQCSKCPWRKDVNPHDIPNGYDVDKHCALKSTIAESPLASLLSDEMHIMACHGSHNAHCIGWFMNQTGAGNNVALRIQMASCQNARQIRTVGAQRETFEQTLPR